MKHYIDFVDVEVHRDLFHDVYKNLNGYEYFLMKMDPFSCCCFLSCQLRFDARKPVIIDDDDVCARIGLTYSLNLRNNLRTRLESKEFLKKMTYSIEIYFHKY